MKIVVRNLQSWEQDLIEDMIKEHKLTAQCGVEANMARGLQQKEWNT